MQPKLTPAYLASQDLSQNFPMRFWSKVNKEGPIQAHVPELGPCWVWTAGLNEAGYGAMMKKWRYGPILSNRASWLLHVGPIPDGLCVLHKCDCRICVRPDHLWLGTRGDNLRDCRLKGRGWLLNGERKYNQKLTKQSVDEIRRLYPSKSQKELSELFGVAQSSISVIVNRRIWK